MKYSRYLILLYPIKPYIFDLVENWPDEEIQKAVSLYDEISKGRHKGYRRVIVLFGQKENPSEPDRDSLWPTIKERPTDIVISCGKSLEDFYLNCDYPDPLDVFSLLPGPIESCIIGGFHLTDCVDKLAEAASILGLLPKVDDDLTDLFFNLKYQKGGVPVKADDSFNSKARIFDGVPMKDLREIKERRKGKPWFTQY